MAFNCVIVLHPDNEKKNKQTKKNLHNITKHIN